MNIQFRRWLVSLFALGCVLTLAACDPVGDLQRYVRGQQLKHVDVEPASASEYIVAAGLDDTSEITFINPIDNQNRTVTAQAAISRVLALLADGGPKTPIAGAKPLQPVRFQLTLGTPERVVTLLYLPNQDRVSLYNVPNLDWHEHFVGNYSVAPEFGPALLAALTGP